MRMLVVEDEDAIAEPLVEGLEREGNAVVRASTGRAAVDAVLGGGFDVVLLDLRLPDISGYEVCRQIRETSTVPIIMVTARGEEVDKVVGLELGADDYLVKPFGFRELLARVGAVTRRAGARHGDDAAIAEPVGNDPPPPWQVRAIGSLSIDRRAHRVVLGGEELDLTPIEFALLAELAGDPGAACTRRHLLREVWNTSWTSSSKTVDVHVASLRRKLGDPAWIETVRGVGYRLAERP